jgi:hypothetical protein
VTLVATMLCVWCGHHRDCQLMDIGWVCDGCWEEAEGITVQEPMAA